MSREQNLATSTEVVRKACPDTMELKFGCEVINEVGEKERVLWSHENWKKGGLDVCLDGTAVPIHESELKQILGTPIGLPEILRTIDKVRPLKQSWHLRYDGLFFEERENKWGAKWNLLKTLEDQEDECLEFLASLLANK